MRWTTLVLVIALSLAGGACNDLRGFQGSWHGPRVGTAAVVRVGGEMNAEATLDVESIDAHGLAGQLSVAGLIDAPFTSLSGAEADALAGMTFSGAPLRVYLAFVPVLDGAGDALALVALYDDHRIEVRVLRGGVTPIYGIFALTE